MSKYDVVIVGAGVAGSAAAKIAAEKGLRTLLLEAGKVPGDKNVSGTAFMLDNARAFPYILDGPMERELYATELNFLDRGGCVTTRLEFHRPLAWVAYRDSFDKWHAGLAQKAGAELRTSVTVVDVIRDREKIKGVLTDKGEMIEAEVVIAAGGVVSTIGRKSGLVKKRTGEDIVLYIKIDVGLSEQAIEERFGNTWKWFISEEISHKVWAWLFPARNGIGIGTGGYLIPPIRDHNFYMQNLLNLPQVERLLEGGQIRSYAAHADPDCQVEKTYTDGLLLIGDAGGFVAPYMGAGMAYSMLSAMHAVETAAAAISKGDTSESQLREFEARWQADKRITGAFKIGQWCKDVAFKHQVRDLITAMKVLSYVTSPPLLLEFLDAAKESDLGKLSEAYQNYKAAERTIELMSKYAAERGS